MNGNSVIVIIKQNLKLPPQRWSR